MRRLRSDESSRSCTRVSGDEDDDVGGGGEGCGEDDAGAAARGAGRAELSGERGSRRRSGPEEPTERASAADFACKASMDPHCVRDSRRPVDTPEDSPGTQGPGADCCRTR